MEASSKADVTEEEAIISMEVNNDDPLDQAEDLLTTKVLQYAISLIKHLRSRFGEGDIIEKIDKKFLEENSEAFAATIGKVQELISGQIGNLKDYVPPERTAYGPMKDAAIMQEKLEFTHSYLEDTLKELENKLTQIEGSKVTSKE